MRPPALIIGYHGCSREIGEAVLQNKAALQPSKNDYDWLGHGIYFWENDPMRAKQWASEKGFENPFVVGAVLRPTRCLDLTEQSSLDELVSAYEMMSNAIRLAGGMMPKNSSNLLRRTLDCAVINSLHIGRESAGLQPYDAVRGPFHEGGALYPGAGMQRKTHVQIAVRHSDTVIGYFLPPDFRD